MKELLSLHYQQQGYDRLREFLQFLYSLLNTCVYNISKDRQMKLLDDMRSDAQWLVRMVENLLSVTRIGNENVHLSKNDTVLEELVDSVLVKFRKHYPNQKIQLEIPDRFVSIPMDVMLIQQVLMNLLENAVFHAKGMENLWLTVEVKDHSAVFRVSDDGCGIPKSKLSGLFSGHLDSNAPNDHSRSSMGIGLSVCSAIIKAHGSEIFAKNRPGGGAEFSFSLSMEEKKNEQ